MLTVAVLGPVELRRDGVLLPVPAGRPSELLVRLALDAGTPVRAERLIQDLWEREAATTGRNTLQSKVSILRRTLGDPALIAAGEHGYVLAVDPAASTPSRWCASIGWSDRCGMPVMPKRLRTPADRRSRCSAARSCPDATPHGSSRTVPGCTTHGYD